MPIIKTILASIVLLVISVSTLSILFLNQTNLKALIANAIDEQTGYHTTILSDVQWSLYPNLGLKIDHLVMDTGQDFSTLNIQHLQLGLKLLPLLQGNVQPGSFQANITSKNHHVNDAMMMINASVIYHSNMKQINLSSIRANGLWRQQPWQATSQCELKINTKQIQCHQFKFVTKDLNLSGQWLATVGSTKPRVRGELQFTTLAPNTLLQRWDYPFNHWQLGHVQGQVTFDTQRPAAGLTSQIHVAYLQTPQLLIKQLYLTLQTRNQVVEVTKIQGDIYGGSFQGNALFNLSESQLSLQGEIKQLEANELWRMIAIAPQKLQLTGRGDLNIDMTASLDINAGTLSHVKGNYLLAMQSGQLLGSNLAYWMNHAFMVRHKDPEEINFDRLTGLFTLKNHVITNDNLIIEMPELMANGKGEIDQQQFTIAYTLKTSLKNPAEQRIGYVKVPALTDVVTIRVKEKLDMPEIDVAVPRS